MIGCCERCGAATNNPRHIVICRQVPKAPKLIAMLESGEFSPRTLASRYNVSEKFIVDRVKLVGVSDEQITIYSHNTEEFRRCRRCDLIIFDEDDNVGNHPEWSLRVQRDISGLCPGCHQYTATGHERLLTDRNVMTSVFGKLSIQ